VCTRKSKSSRGRLLDECHALLSQEGSEIAFFAISRAEVPKPHPYKVCWGTSPRATLLGRAALLTQEGVSRIQSGLFVQSPRREMVRATRFHP
jgi:hypothetical protein